LAFPELLGGWGRYTLLPTYPLSPPPDCSTVAAPLTAAEWTSKYEPSVTVLCMNGVAR